MASKCRKFVPNIFNKSKCQTCFGAKEMHSAEALENNKASRKMSKCGYLFVAPEFDFSNPVNKGKRWQRRFFVLYDDAELTFSVDENPDTVPQGVVDMNKVTDVVDCEAYTGHPFSIAIKSPDKTYYVKGGSKEEIQWWHDILIEFPRALKSIKPRRKTTICVANAENGQSEGVSSKSRTSSEGSINSDLHARDGDASRGRPRGDFPAYSTFRGVRSLKHKYDKNHQEGLRKSSSLHDLSAKEREMETPTALASSRFLSRSGDRLDWVSSSSSSVSSPTPGEGTARGSGAGVAGRLPLLSQSRYAHNPYCTITRTHALSIPPPRRLSPSTFLHPSTTATTTSTTAPSASTSTSSSATSSPPRRGSFDDRHSGARKKNLTAAERARLHRERSASLKDFSAHLSVAQGSQAEADDGSHPGGERRSEGGAPGAQSEDPSPAVSADETASNETDELKMARSDLSMVGRSQSLASPAVAESRPTKYEDLVYMKKGWLVKQANTEKESKKHWFVLAGNSLRYYNDSKAEEAGNLDGRIDLSTCSEVSEVPLNRIYGFKIKTRNGEHVLGAMTSGIRNNWMKAIRLCMDLHNPAGRKTAIPGLSGLAQPPRAQDDFELGATHASTSSVAGSRGETAFQLVGRKESAPSKKESSRVARRHHSDVSPGNVSKVLSIKEFSSFDVDDNPPSSAASTPTRDSEQGSQSGSDVGDGTPRLDSSAQNSPRPRGTKIPKHQTSPDSSSWAQTHLPIRRFVEGSDVASAPGAAAVAKEPKRVAASESSKEEKELERMRRAKSPSARLKERTRRMQSPSRMDSSSSGSSYYRLSTTPNPAPMADVESFESEDDVDMGRDLLSQERYSDSPRPSSVDDGSSAPASISGEGRLVELLESEVDVLKERLEYTEDQLSKMYESNLELKSQLESTYAPVRRQLPSGHDGEDSRRQLKDTRDMVGRQKLELETLHSKLDMSMSKLTGTEKALSEALRELKHEKEKFLKLQGDWNRRIRGMEGQLKDTVNRLDKTKENLTAKERECWRLESEIKGNLQRTRDQEREILKLKAVEQDYRQMKARLDDREREIATLQDQMKEQAQREKKLEASFHQQLAELEQEFARERDDMEQHLEQLKRQLCEAHQRQTSMTSSLTSNIADILHDKDDLIAQLEDQLADSDRKMGDMTEELQAEVKENADLMTLNDTLQEQRDLLASKLAEMEGELVGLQEQLGRVEGEGDSLRQQVEALQQERRLLGEQLEAERRTAQSYQRERDQYQATIRDLNDKIQHLQFRLIEKFEDIDRSVGSGSTEGLDASDLLHHIIIADSELKEVNALLTDLQTSFDSYMATLQDDTRSHVEAMADLMKEVGRKCRDVQDTLKGVPQSPTPPSPGQAPEVRGVDYSHSVTVDENSPAPIILAEYREMKSKFDRAVAEVKKLRKEVNDVYSRYDRMEQQEKALKEELHSKELNYKQRLEVLVSRVETLTLAVDSRRQKPGASPSAPAATPASTSEEIERHIKDLDSKLTSVEKSLSERTAESAASSASSPLLAEEAQVFVSKLNEMKAQLDSTSAKLKSSQAGPASNPLQSHLSRCGQKIESLSKKVEEAAKTAPPVVACDGGGCGESDEEEEEGEGGAVNSGEPVAVNKCLLEVKDRIMEIGEQLDALDEETDSEDEEDEEENTIEAVREKLAGILEYIEQHAKLSQKEWKVLGLVRAQQEAATHQQASHAETPVSADQQLKQYRDRLALEAVIMGEMAFLLQNMSSGSSQDAFLTELHLLNSQIITLHQQLETETRSMHMEDAKEDVLTSYAALLAEKIVLEGKLMPAEEEGEEEEEEGERVATKPTILAAEALLRSQLDSFISAGLDKSLGDMEQASSHIVTKALVQGELTYALQRMREKVGAVERRGGNRQEASRDFAFQEMKARMAMVEELVGAYKLKMVHALAVIITKDTEEMTIVEGPESLLEGICSEISTCMEKHIQNFKEKMRSAASHPDVARKAELAVNSLRALREVVLTAIRQEHQAYNSHDRDEDEHDEVQVPFQSLDSTINNFGEILSQQAIVSAGLDYLQEMYESGLEESMDSESSLLEDKEPATDIDKSLSIFVKNLSEAIKVEAEKKQQLSEELAKRIGERDQSGARDSEDDPEAVVLSMPSVGGLCQGLRPYPVALVREAVFQVQLAYTQHKQRLQHQQELEQLRRVFPGARKAGATSQDSTEEELDLQTLLLPLEEVLETKLEDECQVLSVLQQHCSQVQQALASHASLQQVEEMMRQLEQTFVHEMSRAQERHETHLELFKQETGKLEAKWEERENECAAYEGRCEQLHDDILTLQTEHDEEMDRMRQDIMTAVSAIRANEEQSETQLADQVHRLTMQLAAQRESFKTFLEGVKRESAGKVSAKTIERAEEQLSLLEQGIIPEPLPKHLDEDVTDGAEATEASSGAHENTHVQELEQLRREKEEALAEEVKNTKAALEAMKKAYEEDLSAEKEKYREALVTMYNDDFVNEIRRRHEYELEKLRDEVKQLSLHYSSKCEDYKLLELKLQQIKTDYDSHIQQLIKSNAHLEQLVNQEIEKIKEHIRNKEPSPARLTGNHTLEEELSDAQIMIRVKDAELQKLRSQVKNLENSLQRTTEEHRQTMTQHLQLMKQHGEMQTQFKKEKGELHDRIEQLLEASGSRRPIRRTPSFHSRARSPSPQSTTSPAQKDKSEHSSRDSHRKRHIAPKDLRRSKSSPSLPYVFDAKRPGTREGPGGRRPSATKATKY